MYCVLDLETSGKTTYKRFCNPLDMQHSVTAVAAKLQNKNAHVVYNKNAYKVGIPRDHVLDTIPFDQITLLVGQNLKFDLLWIWRDGRLQNWLKNGGMLWDTMLVEYLLSGQDSSLGSVKSLSLDALAEKYGGTLKDNRISILFKEGRLANEIHPELLLPYAKNDVVNTEIVMKAQYKQAKTENMLPIIKTYMEHLVAIIEMEYNGMYLDKTTAWKYKQEIETELETQTDLIYTLIREFWPKEVLFNPSSLDHISGVLYNTPVKAKLDTPILDDAGQPTYSKTGQKIGQLKTRKEIHDFAVSGYGLPFNETHITKQSNVKSDVEILEKLRLQTKNDKAIEFINELLKYRQLSKLLATYLYSEVRYASGQLKSSQGVLSCLHPDDCIHTEFKMAWTKTGRLSSRNPNIQNLSPDILHLFTSRWADKGVICEFDFSQLEVCIQAYLTQSTQFIEDIKHNVDFHCKRLAYAENMSYDEVKQLCESDPEWKQKRKLAKTISFQKAYGAQASKIAESSGLSLEVVQKVFDQEDQEYPEIMQFYTTILQQLEHTKVPTTELLQIRDKRTNTRITKPGEFLSYGIYQSLTGKKYRFDERGVLTKVNTVFRYFSSPDIQDYPVQGTAADIVALQIGKVFKFAQEHRDKFLMINEVHDSLLIDCKKEHLDWTIEKICAILESVSDTFMGRFKVPFNVPIRVDHGYGANWKECK